MIEETGEDSKGQIRDRAEVNNEVMYIICTTLGRSIDLYMPGAMTVHFQPEGEDTDDTIPIRIIHYNRRQEGTLDSWIIVTEEDLSSEEEQPDIRDLEWGQPQAVRWWEWSGRKLPIPQDLLETILNQKEGHEVVTEKGGQVLKVSQVVRVTHEQMTATESPF